jgi:hypothetical protein
VNCNILIVFLSCLSLPISLYKLSMKSSPLRENGFPLVTLLIYSYSFRGLYSPYNGQAGTTYSQKNESLRLNAAKLSTTTGPIDVIIFQQMSFGK